jgi:hypothetical protein
MLGRYAAEEVVKVEDLSCLVAEQREYLRNDASKLRTPRERIYLPRRGDAIGAIGLDDAPAAIHP